MEILPTGIRPIVILQQLVDKSVDPDQHRDDDRGDDGCGEHAHRAGVVGDGADDGYHIQGDEQYDAHEGEYLFYFFHGKLL